MNQVYRDILLIRKRRKSGYGRRRQSGRKKLKKLSIPDDNSFIDEQKISGKERPRLSRMERRIKQDDLIYVKSLNELGNSYDEILESQRRLS